MKRLITIFIILFSPSLFAQNVNEDQYMDAYVVIVDTSQNYYELRYTMFDLSKKIEKDIDTLGRGYNKSKNLICLPDNDDDEIYAGDYFPRRYPTKTLSLEYLDFYEEESKSNEKTIALVAEITDNKEKANLTLTKIKKFYKTAFLVKASIYMGCMH